jgi:UMF1 family MFS transporter
VAAAGCPSSCSSRCNASRRPSSSPASRRCSAWSWFIIANFSYQAALIYYDATLKTVSNPESRGRLSGIGTAIGYCGTVAVGRTIFLLDVPVVDRFRLAALFFAVFAIPIFLVVREPRRTDEPPITARDVIESFGQLRLTIEHARRVPGLGRFLLGRFFYSDAVNTVIVVMSVVTTEALGVSDRDANTILLGLTVVAIAMSFVWGAMCDRLGPKRTLIVVLGRGLSGWSSAGSRSASARAVCRPSSSPARSSVRGWVA